MAIILDADVVIQGERGVFDLAGWCQEQSDETFAMAAITVAELWHGVERSTGALRAKRERYLRSLLTTLPILPYSEPTAYLHARLWAALAARGAMIGFYDVMVAATALERGWPVATFNVRHFAAVPDLRLIVPSMKSSE
jgi:tRNA(fMet)-specific endonuclease VapC